MAISDLKLPQGVTPHEYRTPVLLAEGLANDVAEQLRAAISARGEATLVVSGGRSPVAFFQNLASQGLDWSKVTITLADERWVPVEHADSNAGLLKKYLLQGPAAKAKFLSLYSAAANLDGAAEQADRLLAELPAIDVLVLGMGDDGHVASLIPGSPVLAAGMDPSGDRYCLGVPAGVGSPPVARGTLTLPALLQARLTLILISGEAKRRIVEAGNGLPVHALLEQAKAPVRILWTP